MDVYECRDEGALDGSFHADWILMRFDVALSTDGQVPSLEAHPKRKGWWPDLVLEADSFQGRIPRW
jgi:hypothetical protein